MSYFVPETSNYTLRIPLFSGSLTSIMFWSYICCQIVSAAFRSIVIIDQSLNFGKIKADNIMVNWSEKIVDKIHCSDDGFFVIWKAWF